MQALQAVVSKLLVLAVIASISLSVVLGIGLILGYVLNRLIPSIELGIATLCGLAAVGICGFVLVSLFRTYAASLEMAGSTEEDELEVSDLLTEAQLEQITSKLSEEVLLQMDLEHRQTARRSKNRR
ncbi:hypothetical protein [Allorhodopirellula solitaria]|uniref:Uncharacterized protein n=1 Tax=Allorhodopirellula solitaria TaxID=2527987 RepID=A0A5C5XPV6_9BACT|nr:hypothetical protein [Allorhodopirellula solitaria]TWT65256.1 hypothetical protein CA85_31680 [Allorhodopirellula solitaria]